MSQDPRRQLKSELKMLSLLNLKNVTKRDLLRIKKINISRLIKTTVNKNSLLRLNKQKNLIQKNS